MSKILDWLSPSVEGADGKASSKALTLLWIVVLNSILHVVFMHIAVRIANKEVATEASLKVMDRIRDLIGIDWTVTLILFGVVTVQTIVQALRAFRGQPDTSPIFTETKTSKTVTEIKPKKDENTNTTTIIPASDS